MDLLVILSPLIDQIVERTAERVAEKLKAAQQDQQSNKLLSPAEVCKLFTPNISVQTLHRWRKQGVIPEPEFIGRKTYWKYKDIISSTKSLKKFKSLII